MKAHCKAKKFQGRMSHRGSGKAVGETRRGGSLGKSAGEKAMGSLTSGLVGSSAKTSRHCQSKDGNGGQ